MSKPPSAPSFETDFSKFMDISKMMDMTKTMGDFKVPSLNAEALMAAHRKNIEAITTANQASFEVFQTLAKRQADMARQNFEAVAALFQAVASAPSPEEKLARHADATKAAMERCVSGVKEISDILAKNNFQALETVSSRVCESLDELQSVVKNGKASS